MVLTVCNILYMVSFSQHNVLGIHASDWFNVWTFKWMHAKSVQLCLTLETPWSVTSRPLCLFKSIDIFSFGFWFDPFLLSLNKFSDLCGFKFLICKMRTLFRIYLTEFLWRVKEILCITVLHVVSAMSPILSRCELLCNWPCLIIIPWLSSRNWPQS